eukprot:Skav219758  [mRNA]  locus=scaffold569:234335:235094:- [translate_table: standard]
MKPCAKVLSSNAFLPSLLQQSVCFAVTRVVFSLAAGRLGLPPANLTAEQLELPETQRAATLGRLFGVQLGVLLGSTTLLLQSPKESKEPKELRESKESQSKEHFKKAKEGSSESSEEFEALTSSGVVVFAHPGCPSSRAAMDKLVDRGVSFKVASFDQFSVQLKSAGSTGPPSIWVSGRSVDNLEHL